MGPFGSNRSRHVDDFGAKNHNFDDLDAKENHFDDFSMKQKELRASIYRRLHVFIDGRIYL